MKKTNVPRLRFNGFSGEWKEEKLGDVTIRFDNKRVPIKESNRVHGCVPYYGANGIQDYVEGMTHTGNNILIAEDGANDINNYPVFHTEGNIWVNNHAHVLKSQKNKSDSLFISYCLKMIPYSKYLTGNGRYKLNADVLMEIKVNIPCLSEQQKIGSFFAKQDKLIELQTQKVDQLKKLKRGYLQKMFPQEGETVPRLRFSGFSGEWKEDKLLNFSKLRTGNRNVQESLDNGKYVFFDRSNEIKLLNEFEFEGKVLVYPGEGAKFLPRKFEGKYSLHQRAYGLYDFKNIDYEFLFQELLTQNRHFLRYSVGTTAKSLRKDCFERLIIKFADFQEQQKIGEFFAKLDKLIEEQSNKLDQLKQQKKAYLQKMFI